MKSLNLAAAGIDALGLCAYHFQTRLPADQVVAAQRGRLCQHHGGPKKLPVLRRGRAGHRHLAAGQVQRGDTAAATTGHTIYFEATPPFVNQDRWQVREHRCRDGHRANGRNGRVDSGSGQHRAERSHDHPDRPDHAHGIGGGACIIYATGVADAADFNRVLSGITLAIDGKLSDR